MQDEQIENNKQDDLIDHDEENEQNDDVEQNDMTTKQDESVKRLEANERVRARAEMRRTRLRFVFGLVFLAVVGLIIALVVFFTRKETYDDSYFVSDDSKLVVAMDKEYASYEESEYEPDVTYILYYYGGDNINNMEVFFAYKNDEEAAWADENISIEDKSWATGKRLRGKYIIFSVNREQFDGVTVNYIKDLIEDIEAAGMMYEPDKEIQDDIIDNAGDGETVETTE